MNILKTLLLLALTLSPVALPCQTAAEEITTQTTSSKIMNYLEAHRKRLRGQRRVAFVDYSLPLHERRFFVFDTRKKEIVYSTFVGHSPYSGNARPVRTSNVPNTRKTSVGLFKIGKEYYGRFGRSKKLHGLSKTNSNAYKRAIIVHSMPGIEVSDLYSWGCFTFFEHDLQHVFSFMKKGTYLLAVK